MSTFHRLTPCSARPETWDDGFCLPSTLCHMYILVRYHGCRLRPFPFRRGGLKFERLESLRWFSGTARLDRNRPCCAQLPQFEVSTPRTFPAGIHPTVAEFESQRPGSRRDGWHACRGCTTLVSSRGTLETWEFPVPPGCPQRRPVCGEPTKQDFNKTQQEREEVATDPAYYTHSRVVLWM